MRRREIAAVSCGVLLFIGCAEKKAPPPPPPPVQEIQAEYEQDWTGITESVSISSTPTGASVRLSTGEKCKTPCSLKRPILENFDVTIEKNGFVSKTVSVVSHSNIVPGSGASGRPKLAKPKLSPSPVSVVLNPEWER